MKYMLLSMIKQNRTWMIGYSLGTSLYIFMLAAVFPSIKDTGLIESKLQSLPPEMLKLFNYDPDTLIDNIMNLLAGNYYGLIFFIITILFALTFASRVMGRPVDSGELILYMAAPISRRQYTFASLSVLFIASVLFVLSNGLTLVAANLIYDLDIDMSHLWALQLNAFALLIALGAVAYFIATLFNDSGKSYMVSAVVLGVFLVMTILSGLDTSLENLQYASLFTLFDANAIIDGKHGYITDSLILIGFGGALLTMTAFSFERKDLTI